MLGDHHDRTNRYPVAHDLVIGQRVACNGPGRGIQAQHLVDELRGVLQPFEPLHRWCPVREHRVDLADHPGLHFRMPAESVQRPAQQTGRRLMPRKIQGDDLVTELPVVHRLTGRGIPALEVGAEQGLIGVFRLTVAEARDDLVHQRIEFAQCAAKSQVGRRGQPHRHLQATRAAPPDGSQGPAEGCRRAFALSAEVETEQCPADDRQCQAGHLALDIDGVSVVGCMPILEQACGAVGHRREVLLELRRAEGRVCEFALAPPHRAFTGYQAITQQDVGAIIDRALDVVLAPRTQYTFHTIRMRNHHQPMAERQPYLKQRPVLGDQLPEGLQQIPIEEGTDRP